MATASGRRLGSDKEVAAVTFNLKEQRCLEKTLQTLDLEESYARKLLELDQRIVRVSYKRLKDRVGRIKSYLKPEHIAEIRTLEVDGKFRPQTTGVNLSCALKIASAARRLKLGQMNKAKTNIRIEVDRADLTELTMPTLRKANSLSGISVDELEESKLQRCKSDKKVRAQTAHGFREVRKPHRKPRAQTSTGVRTAFTSHADKKNENESQSKQHVRKTSVSSNVSDFGENPYEERRQNLLSVENLKAKGLVTRKESFVHAVEDYVDANPLPVSAISDQDADDVRQTNKFRTLEDRLVELNNTKLYRKIEGSMPDALVKRPSRRLAIIEENKKMPVSEERLATFWQHITKCRYSSIPDNQLNITGIITMLHNQDKMTTDIKPTKIKTISKSETVIAQKPISPAVSTKSFSKFVSYEV